MTEENSIMSFQNGGSPQTEIERDLTIHVPPNVRTFF